jgi:hypothetical protein
MHNCSTSLVIEEMQIKTTLRFHLTQVRMAIIKGNNKNQMLARLWLNRILLHSWWDTTTMANSMEIPQKTKERTAI